MSFLLSIDSFVLAVALCALPLTLANRAAAAVALGLCDGLGSFLHPWCIIAYWAIVAVFTLCTSMPDRRQRHRCILLLAPTLLAIDNLVWGNPADAVADGAASFSMALLGFALMFALQMLVRWARGYRQPGGTMMHRHWA